MKKIILSSILFLIGSCYLFWFSLLNEYNLIEIVCNNVDCKELEQYFGFETPNDLKVYKMTTKRTFVDDQLQTVTIYSNYSEEKWNNLLSGKWDESIHYHMNQEKSALNICYFEDKLKLGVFFQKNGIEDRRLYNIQLAKHSVLILLIMLLPWINIKYLSNKFRTKLRTTK